MWRLLLVVFLVTSLCGCVNDDVAPSVSVVSPGQEVPLFQLALSDGSVFNSHESPEAMWMLVFFSTSCPDCRRYLPQVQALHERLPHVAIVCVSRDDAEDAVADYWTGMAMTVPCAVGTGYDVYRQFATSGVPRVYVTDVDRRVVAVYDDTDLPDVDTLASLFDR